MRTDELSGGFKECLIEYCKDKYTQCDYCGPDLFRPDTHKEFDYYVFVYLHINCLFEYSNFTDGSGSVYIMLDFSTVR